MAEQFGDFIITEVKKLYNAFMEKDIELKERRALQYSVKYEVKYKGSEKGEINLYYKPKKDKFTFKEDTGKSNIDCNLVSIMQDIIDNRYSIHTETELSGDTDTKIDVDTKSGIKTGNKESKNKELLLNRLKDYYEKLKPYRSYDFDFSQFASELEKCFRDEYIKRHIQDSIYEFSILEEYYFKAISGK